MWLPRSLRFASSNVRNRLIAVSSLHRDVVDFGSNILGQVIQQNNIDPRRGIAGAQHELPLHETRGRNIQFRIGAKINASPLAPVAIRIVYVATTSIEFNI